MLLRTFFLVIIVSVNTYASSFSENVEQLHNFLFNTSDQATRTDSTLILKNGKIIYENYRDANYKIHKVWSLSKSVTNALIGISINQKKLKLSDSICKFFKNLDTNKCSIKIQHLLEWSSGINWTEDYSENIETSTVLQMFYGDGAKDMLHFALGLPLKYQPNLYWSYSSADPTILMGILKSIYGHRFLTLPSEELFQPIGMKDTAWEVDSAKTFLASSHLFSTPRDLAKFAQWFMNKGQILDSSTKGSSYKFMLPPYWIKYSSTVSSSYNKRKSFDSKEWGYKIPAGPGWWINKGTLNNGKIEPWPSAPSDTLAALGYKGQYLFLIPSKNLIVVRLGYDKIASNFDENRLLKLAIELGDSTVDEGVGL